MMRTEEEPGPASPSQELELEAPGLPPILQLDPAHPHSRLPEGFPFHDLTLEQRSLYSQLREAIDVTKDQYSPAVQAWVDEDVRVLVRYLRAVRWDVGAALQRLHATMRWREEYQPHLITPDQVVEETQTGKIFLHGFDREGCPILILSPARENTKNYEAQLRHVVFYLETVQKLMPPGSQSVTMIVDYENTSIMNAPPLHVTKTFITTIGDHYPELMNKSFVINPSWYIHVVLKFITPFMDPVTRAKIHLVNSKEIIRLQEKEGPLDEGVKIVKGGHVNPLYFIPSDQLQRGFGGKNGFEWEFPVYWAALCARLRGVEQQQGDSSSVREDVGAAEARLPLSQEVEAEEEAVQA